MNIYPSFKKSDFSKSTPKREERHIKQHRRELNILKVFQRSKICWRRTINTILEKFTRIVQHTFYKASDSCRLHEGGPRVYCGVSCSSPSSQWVGEDFIVYWSSTMVWCLIKRNSTMVWCLIKRKEKAFKKEECQTIWNPSASPHHSLVS